MERTYDKYSANMLGALSASTTPRVQCCTVNYGEVDGAGEFRITSAEALSQYIYHELADISEANL